MAEVNCRSIPMGYKKRELWTCLKCEMQYDGHSIMYHNDPHAPHAHACPKCGGRVRLFGYFLSKVTDAD